jgi:hypothetical protein
MKWSEKQNMAVTMIISLLTCQMPRALILVFLFQWTCLCFNFLFYRVRHARTRTFRSHGARDISDPMGLTDVPIPWSSRYLRSHGAHGLSDPMEIAISPIPWGSRTFRSRVLHVCRGARGCTGFVFEMKLIGDSSSWKNYIVPYRR